MRFSMFYKATNFNTENLFVHLIRPNSQNVAHFGSVDSVSVTPMRSTGPPQDAVWLLLVEIAESKADR